MELEKEIRKVKYIVEDEANLQAGAIDGKTRFRNVVLARMVLSNFLMVEVGLKEETCRKYICRDRTSFYYYQKKHDLYISDGKIYPEYNDLYNTVKFRYFSEDDTLFDGINKNVKLEQLSEIDSKLLRLKRDKIALEKEIRTLS